MFSAIISVTYRNAKREYEKAQKIVQKKQELYKKSINEGKDDRQTIEEHYTTFQEAATKRDELGEENDYTSMMKEIEGGIELKKLLVKFKKNKKNI